MSLTLCTALIFGSSSVYGANENNDRGVSFSVNLDTPIIEVSDTDQQVVMHLTANKEITMGGMGLQITNDSPLQLTSIRGGEERIDLRGADYNLANGMVGWTSSDAENISGITNMLTATFTVPANTPAGSYQVGIKDLELTQDYGTNIWENKAMATATLTVEEATVSNGYTAEITTLTKEINVDDSIAVNVGIKHSSDESFAAGEVTVKYDNTKMAFQKDSSTLGNATVNDEAGMLTLEDYGADKQFGTGVYVLVFDAIADGDANVELTSAAFVDKENAVKEDLIPAELMSKMLSVTINKKSFHVTLPDIFNGPNLITEGEDYTFSLADGEHYNYTSISATMNGEVVTVIDNGNGTYTIKNVIGDLVINGNRTEKSFVVSISGNAAEDVKDAEKTAVYNTDYSFTMPSAEGWAYSLDSITIGGEIYTGYSVKDSVYTIPGKEISGDIVITVSKKRTIVSVIVEGSGAGAATGYETSAEIGKPYTLTIKKEAGYDYTVTAFIDEKEVSVKDNGDSTYTIANVTGNLRFNIERTVIVNKVSVSEYLSLDGTVMWLIKNDITLEENSIPTYDGKNMYWSETYNAYCYLVIANTLTTEEVADKIGITNATAVTIDNGMDVNCTGKVDASDAQLAYNMYNAMYKEFTGDVTIEKFLRADTNADGKVNVSDATAIIANIIA